MIHKLLIGCLMFVFLFFLTCMPPLFDEGTSLAFLTAKKLTLLGQYGPVYQMLNSSLDYIDMEAGGIAQIYYLPDKSPSNTKFDRGFIIGISKSDNLVLKYVSNQLEGTTYKMRVNWNEWGRYIGPLDNFHNSFKFTLLASSPTESPSLGLILNNKGQYYQIVMGCTPTPSPLQIGFNPSPLPSITPTPPPLSTNYISPPGSKIVAANFQDKIKFAAYERLVLLTLDDNYKFCESYGDVSSNGLITNYLLTSMNLGLPIPSDVSQAFYFHNFFSTPQYSYLSYYRDGLFHALRWSIAAGGSLANVKTLPAIMHKLDAVLSTGQLFAVVNQTAYIYNADGQKEFDFPLGDLHFAYEVDNNGTTEPIMIFTLVKLIYDKYNDQQGTGIFFDIYTIPTKDLASLK